jgi:peptide subunit release factor 1 (eRF1)
LESCPVCKGTTERLADVVEYAAEQAYLSGADVNTVLGAAKDALVARGGIGATLRY